MVASAPAITAHMGTTLRTSYIPVAGQEDDLYPYLYGAFYERQYIDRKYGIVDGRYIALEQVWRILPQVIMLLTLKHGHRFNKTLLYLSKEEIVGWKVIMLMFPPTPAQPYTMWVTGRTIITEIPSGLPFTLMFLLGGTLLIRLKMVLTLGFIQ